MKQTKPLSKIVGFRVHPADEHKVRELVRKFLAAKGYKLYSKTKHSNK